MKILILGGTQFVGRTLTEQALAAGHEVTLFNRGKTNADLFPEVEKLVGDRDGGLDPLKGRQWDRVIDPSGYIPRLVKDSAELLADAVEHYTFISTISVYDESIYSSEGATEDAPLATLEDETVEEITGQTYGGLKVLCEQAAENAMPGRVLHARCGLIVGPYDPTDRFSYWPINTARREVIVAPPAAATSQVIDVRDLASWLLHMSVEKNAGTFNTTGPDYALTYGRIMEACQAASKTPTEVIYATEDFLLENEVQPWADLPLWLPTSHAGMSKIDVSKATSAGLTFRPIEETTRDIIAWYKDTRGLDDALKTGISAEREAELLAKWHESTPE